MEGIVIRLGFTVSENRTSPQYHDVSLWTEIAPRGYARTDLYTHLSYTEMVDVILAIIEDNRIGTQYNGALQQDRLW